MKNTALLSLATAIILTGMLVGCGKSGSSQQSSSTQPENTQVLETGQIPPNDNSSQSDNKYFNVLIESTKFKTYFQEQDGNFGAGVAGIAGDVNVFLSDLYGSEPSTKTNLFIFKDLSEAENLGFRSGAPTKTDANSNSGEFTLVEPLGDGVKLYVPQQNKNFEHGNDAAIRFLVAHEVSHRYFYYLFPNVRSPVRPNWLDEGLAMYTGIEASSRFHLFEPIIQSVKTGSPALSGITNLDNLRNSADTSGVFYSEAATIIYFLYVNFGEQLLHQLLTEFNNNLNLSLSFESVLGISLADFEQVWMERIRQIAGQCNTGDEFYQLLTTKISIPVTPSSPPTTTPSEQPDKTMFDRYFKSLSLAKLPQEWVGKDGWHMHLIDTNIFSEGETLVVRGEALTDVLLTTRYYDINTKMFLGDTATPPPRKTGSFAMSSVINLAPGDYEQKCYANGVLVAVLPFSVNRAEPEPLTMDMSFLQVNDSRGKYLVKSLFHWNGGNAGFYVESISISYRNESLTEFFHQGWTAESLKQAWGGSNQIKPGEMKDWSINVFTNEVTSKISLVYTCKIKDNTGNVCEISIMQDSLAPN